MNIPPRPVVEPALSSGETREKVAAALAAACEAAARGDEAGITAGFEQAGQAGVDAIRAYIDSGIPPPNAPITVSGGWKYHPTAHVSFYIRGKGFNQPMYDTGALYHSFQYQVKKR